MAVPAIVAVSPAMIGHHRGDPLSPPTVVAGVSEAGNDADHGFRLFPSATLPALLNVFCLRCLYRLPLQVGYTIRPPGAEWDYVVLYEARTRAVAPKRGWAGVQALELAGNGLRALGDGIGGRRGRQNKAGDQWGKYSPHVSTPE